MNARFRKHAPIAISIALATSPNTARAANKTAIAKCTEAAENGQQLRANGQLRAAAKDLAVCVAHECPSVVRRDCGKWLEETSDAIPSVVVKVVDASGHDVGGGQLYFDDELLMDKLDGRATQVDPGAHRLAYVNGSLRVEENVVIREGERNRSVVLHLPGPPTATVAPVPARTVPEKTATTSPLLRMETPPPIRPSRSAWPWVLGGAGVVAGAAGGTFWFIGSDAHASLGTTCAPTHSCSVDAVRRAQTNLVVGDVLVGAGVVALTTAIIWLLER